MRPSWSAIVSVLLFSIAILHAGGGATLFPTPMHLHRTITDSVSGASVEVDEYCAANRIVTVRGGGERTVIADYDRQEITEIDRRSSTYSVTRFEEIAKAREAAGTSSPDVDWAADSSSSHVVTLRRGDRAGEEVEIEFDPSTTVTSAAIEVLIGERYPNASSSLGRAIARVLHRGGEIKTESTIDPGSSLPLSITHRYRLGGATAEVRNRVTRVDHDALPPAAAEILPGYRRVDSKIVITARELRDLDSLHPLPREP